MVDDNRAVYTFWDSYRNEIVPQGCSEAQLTETRRAFYAGFAAAHYLTGTIMSADNLSNAEINILLDEIHHELEQFRFLVQMKLS